jgi:hypothetical protein
MSDIIHSSLDLEPTEPFNDNFGDLGFGSRYFLNNMGTMILFYVFYPLFILLERLIFRCRNCSVLCWKFHRSLRKSLYWNAILTGIFESYALIATCCLISLPMTKFDTYGWAVQSSVCIVFTVAILTVPYLMINHVVQNFNFIGDNRI